MIFILFKARRVQCNSLLRPCGMKNVLKWPRESTDASNTRRNAILALSGRNDPLSLLRKLEVLDVVLTKFTAGPQFIVYKSA